MKALLFGYPGGDSGPVGATAGWLLQAIHLIEAIRVAAGQSLLSRGISAAQR